MDGISVYKARLRMGEKLAEKIQRERPEHDIDVVIPIPDTSRTAALELANHLGVKFREGFVKNRYIGRTFIMPGQAARKKSVRQKLNAIELEFRGKNVMLVDDSIVRGTTCKQIIQMAREAGAKNVYFCSAAPAVRYPNVYGIDMPSAHELIAHDRSTEEVAELIGADWRWQGEDRPLRLRGVRWQVHHRRRRRALPEQDRAGAQRCVQGQGPRGQRHHRSVQQLSRERLAASGKPVARIISGLRF
jgi:amidophosphoribosyltransferase